MHCKLPLIMRECKNAWETVSCPPEAQRNVEMEKMKIALENQVIK